MASLRLLARARPRAFLPAQVLPKPLPRVDQITKRDSSYRGSEIYDENKNYANFEVIQNPKEWKFVERLLPLAEMPEPKSSSSVKGWNMPTAKPEDNPYFIRRTKNYMYPVYLQRTHRGQRRVTELRKIEGDIWALNAELQPFLETKVNFYVPTQVNEFAQYIRYKGDVVRFVKEWLNLKGF